MNGNNVKAMMYLKEENAERLSKISRSIQFFNLHVSYMKDDEVKYGYRAIAAADYRLSHTKNQVLNEGYELCRQVAYFNSLANREAGCPFLSRKYAYEDVAFSAQIDDNEICEMLSDFQSVAAAAGISATMLL